MRYKPQSHRSVIKVLGEADERQPTGKMPLTLLKQLSAHHSIQEEQLIQIIDYLLSNGLASEEKLEGKEKFYSLTRKGSRVFWAIQGTPGLVMPYESVAAESMTNDELNNEIEFIEIFFENWVGEFVHVLGDVLSDKGKLDNSIFFCYAAAQSMIFDWLAHSLFSGCYEIVLRELRSILEGLFTAYNLDIKYPDQSLDEKLDTMSDLEKNRYTNDKKALQLFGKKAFQMSGVGQWQDYYLLYKELCAYVHISRKNTGYKMQEIAKKGFADVIDPEFDRSAFTRCVEAWKKVAVLAVSLTRSLLKVLKIEFEILPIIFDPKTYRGPELQF